MQHVESRYQKECLPGLTEAEEDAPWERDKTISKRVARSVSVNVYVGLEDLPTWELEKTKSKRATRLAAVSVYVGLEDLPKLLVSGVGVGGCDGMLSVLDTTIEDLATQECFWQYSIECPRILQKVQKREWSYLKLDCGEPK